MGHLGARAVDCEITIITVNEQSNYLFYIPYRIIRDPADDARNAPSSGKKTGFMSVVRTCPGNGKPSNQ